MWCVCEVVSSNESPANTINTNKLIKQLQLNITCIDLRIRRSFPGYSLDSCNSFFNLINWGQLSMDTDTNESHAWRVSRTMSFTSWSNINVSRRTPVVLITIIIVFDVFYVLHCSTYPFISKIPIALWLQVSNPSTFELSDLS